MLTRLSNGPARKAEQVSQLHVEILNLSSDLSNRKISSLPLRPTHRCTQDHLIPSRPTLHRVNVGLPIGRATTALAFPNHLAQRIHGFVVRVVQ
jgi:hypothetical protein